MKKGLSRGRLLALCGPFATALLASALVAGTMPACGGATGAGAPGADGSSTPGKDGSPQPSADGTASAIVDSSSSDEGSADAWAPADALESSTVDASVPIDGSLDASSDGDASDSSDSADASACVSSVAPAPTATMYVSNPAATETQNGAGYVLHKELNGYPNYGVADDAADILYTGEVALWTFTLPVDAGTITSATVVLSVVADDHASGTATQFSYELWPSACVFSDVGDLPYGTPFNSPFTDWVQRSYPAEPTAGVTYSVTMTNTSNATVGDWIGIDWIELRVTTE